MAEGKRWSLVDIGENSLCKKKFHVPIQENRLEALSL